MEAILVLVDTNVVLGFSNTIYIYIERERERERKREREREKNVTPPNNFFLE